jgi:uncharacterized protein (TIGR00725 family)
MHIPNIGVAASSEGSNRHLAHRFVGSLDVNVRLFLGGYWGLMKDVADEAADRGIFTVLILPIGPKETPPDRPQLVSVDTGMEYRARSVLICRSCDVLVALGGEAGTIIEVYMAYAMGRPVVVLRNTGHTSDKLQQMGEALDQRGTAKIYFVDEPEDAAKLSLSLASNMGGRRTEHLHG